jgi:putative OPT family oligopeptide transporter
MLGHYQRSPAAPVASSLANRAALLLRSCVSNFSRFQSKTPPGVSGMESSSPGDSAAPAAEAQPQHRPYVPSETVVPEFTWGAVVVGAVLGIIFGASSLYLVLKVGMTISASVPVAVLSITLFRLFSKIFKVRRATILENNIVQTTGSAGESIAFGVGVTMPALMLLGFDMDVTRVMVVAVLGGALGILMMIPLRRAFIVKQHGTLIYPEGTACADVLIVGEKGGASAQTVFLGFGIAAVFQFLRSGMKLFMDTVSHPLRWFPGATLSMDADPALLGVGYIIGTRISCVMVAGGILAYLVFAPAIHFFGDGLTVPLEPGKKLIAQMSIDELRNNYILYIGAGAVAAGGIISLVQAMPLILGAIGSGLRDVRAGLGGGNGRLLRTDRDIRLPFVAAGMLLLVLAIWVSLRLGGLFSGVNLIAAVLIVLFGFLFVTVSSRLTGEIGSSSNPISGMTVATLLLTCLIFLVLGWTDSSHRLMALSVAAIVCVAASNGGTTSQDLKTGYLVGATPRHQQWAILVGSISSALVIGVVLIAMNRASTVYTARNLPQPRVPIDVAQLTKQEKAPGDDRSYFVWQAAEQNPQGVPQGKYLVDAKGELRWLVDPGINGRINRRDNGAAVLKFTAPQARLMALITQGILTQKLPWILVLLGVAIAVVLELSGVPALPFAVGVYIPLSSSTPIFLGGLVRYAVHRWKARSAVVEQPNDETDMSPGMLLATGYIAGGAIAGVIIAFLSFSEDIPTALAHWQYRQYTLHEPQRMDEVLRTLADRELGVADLGLTASPAEKQLLAERDRLADDIRELNADRIPQFATVPQGAALKLPDDSTYRVPAATTLGEVARQTLGDAGQAPTLLELNAEQVKPPASLPVGAELRLPQRTAPAVLLFGGLALVLTWIGVGWRRKRGIG